MKNLPNSRKRKMRTWEPGEKAYQLNGSGKDNVPISLIDLASNDYLGLSQDPRLIEAAHKTMLYEGVGAGGSRLVTGSRPIHKKLEKELGRWLGLERVLLFPSGFQANLAAVCALANRTTPVIADKLIHHSLLVGIKASGAKMKRFAHNNIIDLERILQNCVLENPLQPPLVITESLFSMEGTSPDIKKVATLCENYKARLLVDEAHALGVMGSKGRGLCHGISKGITMISGTFGKAFGSGGAFLATNKTFGEHLLQTSGAFRYTTALAPPLASAALEALKLLKENPKEGRNLQKESMLWRSELSNQGWDSPKGNGPIISLELGTDEASLNKQYELEQNGLLTIAIRPPTVPEGTSRLRIIVRSNLPEKTLKKLLFHLGEKQ